MSAARECGGPLCTGCKRHDLASIGLGEARFACGHVAPGNCTGANLLREAEGPCHACRPCVCAAIQDGLDISPIAAGEHHPDCPQHRLPRRTA